ncbi:MAG: hypothetical protein H5T97_00195 [Firmicutes bacterium]|nr:hypothetical protein [Bacillota bacterium]
MIVFFFTVRRVLRLVARYALMAALVLFLLSQLVAIARNHLPTLHPVAATSLSHEEGTTVDHLVELLLEKLKEFYRGRP